MNYSESFHLLSCSLLSCFQIQEFYTNVGFSKGIKTKINPNSEIGANSLYRGIDHIIPWFCMQFHSDYKQTSQIYFSFVSTSGCLTTDNKKCIFPWTYSIDGSKHQGCANPAVPDKDPGGLWCPTGVDDGVYISGSEKWGYCSDDCCTKPGKDYKIITKNLCFRCLR